MKKIYSLIHHGVDVDNGIGLDVSFDMFTKEYLVDYIKSLHNITEDDYEEDYQPLCEEVESVVDDLLNKREAYFDDENYYIYVNQVKEN